MVLVGHSFGGAVVITAGVLHEHVAGVVALAPQTYGARLAGQLAPRPLLVVHGKADTRLPYTCGVADLRLGTGAQTAGLVRGRRAPPGRMRRRTGPAVNTVDSGDPPLRSIQIVYATFYCGWAPLSCFEVLSGKSGLLLNVVLTLRVLQSWVPISVNRRVSRGSDPRATARLARARSWVDLRHLSKSAPGASRRLEGRWSRCMARGGGATRRPTRVRRRLEDTVPTTRAGDTALYTPWTNSPQSNTPDSDTAARAAARRRAAVRSKRRRGPVAARPDRGRNTHWRATWA